MIRNSWVLALLLCLALCLAGCLTQNESPSLAYGNLKLVAVGDDLQPRLAVDDDDVLELGDIDGSMQQFFILQNSGNAPVTGIELSTDNPNFTFSPSSIPTLPPSDGLSMVQVIKLNIVHGRRLDAEGWGGLLPAGETRVALKVTASGNAGAAPIRLDATVRLNARVMDATLFDEGTPMDFSSPNLYVVGGSVFPGSQTVPVYTPTGTTRLVNNGNVPLLLRRWKSAAPLDSVVVAPGATYALQVESFEGGLTGLELDARGVVSDPAKFRKNIDGRFFFRVTRPLGTPAP